MTINNIDSFVNGLWDWGFLDGCFSPTRIKMSDVDGECERNGHFITIEAKPPGKELSTGQEIKLARRAQKGDTVIIVWGEFNEVRKIQVWRPHQVRPSPPHPCSNDGLIAIVRKWFIWADQNGA